MYQNCCKKCGSLDLFTEVKGTNTGLYCSDCGSWLKWVNKDELRAFNHVKPQTDDKLSKVRAELLEERKLAYEIFDELFEKRNKTELENKVLYFASNIMQTHGYLLDR